MHSKPKLSVVVPCYNEEKNISFILEAFEHAMRRDDIEVILVDNGSTDRSPAAIKALAPRYRFLRVVTVPVNQGYGFGVLEGLRAAQGDYFGWMHGDMQTSPADALRTLEIIEEQKNPTAVYVKGKRRGRSLFDLFFTVGMSIFETAYLGHFFWDINAQPNIFPRSFFESWENPPTDFALDLYALYMAKERGMRIIRFPVQFPKRVHGASSWNTGFPAKWKFIKRTVTFSAALKKRI